MLACCQNNPDDKIAFMLKYLEDHYGDRATQGDKTALEAIRSETTRLKGLSD